MRGGRQQTQPLGVAQGGTGGSTITAVTVTGAVPAWLSVLEVLQGPESLATVSGGDIKTQSSEVICPRPFGEDGAEQRSEPRAV